MVILLCLLNVALADKPILVKRKVLVKKQQQTTLEDLAKVRVARVDKEAEKKVLEIAEDEKMTPSEKVKREHYLEPGQAFKPVR